MNDIKFSQNLDSSEAIDDDINLNLLLKKLIRNKTIIGSISLISFILACLYSLSLKKLWEGQFQIVLDTNKERTNSIQLNPALQRFTGLAKMGSNSLQTEVGILESPSVLMPIFELVNAEKKKLNTDMKELDFLKWKEKNLEIKLKKGTSILNIFYRDTDRELILPVLNTMTKTYQEYSGRNKRRSQDLTKDYLNKQITLFKNKSKKSINKAQEFAIDQDLNFQNFNRDIQDYSFNKTSQNKLGQGLLIPNIGIENIRVNAANEIRRIDSQINKIKEIGNDYEQLQYIGSTIPALVEEGLPKSLKEIEDKLVDLRSKYTEKDRSIIRLIEKRDLLISLLKKRSIGILEAQKLVSEAQMNAAMRPKGVLIRYKELIREAQNDESTFIDLENQLRLVNLEMAKFSDPWELITEPTVQSSPVAPNKRRIGLIGLIFGLFLGALVSLYKEKKSGYIYDIEDLRKNFSVPIFEVNISQEKQKLESEINLLVDFIKASEGKNVSIFPLENFDNKTLNILLSSPNISNKLETSKNISLHQSDEDFEKFTSSDIKFLTGTLGKISFFEIQNIKRRMEFYEIKLSGIIIFK
ncbi:MAG: hypothetical protein CBC84_000030 [Pelagibacteraceae bacterium TMED124]|nr:MAG: hypothetical protein CBC84_000030 [Pelagibacteraceae bacterium TMED124]|tara:strand:- start:2502 stop:4247 length:1746 start_codon:yes stop_codon:yes gene_type:complete